jgi:hypothetical protein
MREEARERRDFPPVGVALALLGLLTLLLAIGAGLLPLERTWLPRERAPFPALPATSPLEEAEFESGALRERRYAEQFARLERYEWVDRAAGVARIPLARAMELTAEGMR